MLRSAPSCASISNCRWAQLRRLWRYRAKRRCLSPTEVPLHMPWSRCKIQTLPILNRNFINLALITPGTVPQAPGTQAGGFSVSGMRAQSNNFTLDGVNNNDPQVNGPLNTFNMTDAIQEFTVQTSIAGAEVGRNPGAEVSIVTKSGSNAYHGSFFYYGRNEALDANDYFLKHSPTPKKKNELRRHQFGGTMGGYIVPNKTFWFGSFEAVKQINPLPQTARVPTPAEQAAVTDPVSRRLLQFFPQPNTPLVSGRNWAGVVPQTNYNETYLLKVDHNFSSSHRMFARGTTFLGRTNVLQTNDNPFNGNNTNWPSSHSYVVDDNFNTTHFVNEARFAFSRNHTLFKPGDVLINPASIFTDAAGVPLPGFVNTKTDPLDGGLPRITISGLSNLGAGTNMPQGRATNTYQLTDDVSWNKGTHTLRFGGEIRREITNRFLNGNFRGAVSFGSFARFAAGLPRFGSLRTGGLDQTFRNWFKNNYYFYVQDTWKARSNLTLTAGLRYELPGAFEEIHNRGSNFVPGLGMVALGSNQLITIDPTKQGRNAIVLTPTNVFLPRSGQFTTKKTNFGPYLGVTYSPNILPSIFGNGKTVIRTGFRLSHDEVFNNIPVNMGLNGPQLLSTTLPTGTYTWATVLNQNTFLYTRDDTLAPIPPSTIGLQSLVNYNAWDTHAPSAYGMNYALEIERQIGSHATVGASYVGSQGRKLGIFLDANEPFVKVIDGTKHGDTPPNIRSFPYPQYNSIAVGALRGSSHYNAMVLTYRQRAFHGLAMEASYSYGKSLDFNSNFFGSDRDAGSPADARNLGAEKGRSDFDVRHRIVISYIYDIPLGHGHWLLGDSPGFMNQIFGNWQVSGIATHRSGFPFTVWSDFLGTDFSGLNQFQDRANFKPGVSSLQTTMSNPDAAFATTVFTNPNAGSIGNTHRNAFGGPASTNWDFGVLKSFPIAEGKRLQFRAEFFNFLNHPQFNLPVTNLSSSSAGKITSDSNAGPRLTQLGLRFEF